MSIKRFSFPPEAVADRRINGSECEYCGVGVITEAEGMQYCPNCRKTYWFSAYTTVLGRLPIGTDFVLVGDATQKVFVVGKHEQQSSGSCNVHYLNDPDINAWISPDAAVRRLLDRYIGDTFSMS
jgi:hypothetical protein